MSLLGFPEIVICKPFASQQRATTSGLIRKVNVFTQPHFIETYIQSIFNNFGTSIIGCTLVVGGDGRYFMGHSLQIILSMCIANRVGRVYVPRGGIFTTPAASILIKKYNAKGGIILTAGHYAGGPENVFGIKFNIENGGPAPQETNAEIIRCAAVLNKYKIYKHFTCPIDVIGTHEYKTSTGTSIIDVINPITDYVLLIKQIFKFHNLINMRSKKVCKAILIDAMNGAAGPYVHEIFVNQLGFPVTSVKNTTPLPDFGGKAPNPELSYVPTLIKQSMHADFYAAVDGDGSRSMLLGSRGFIISSSDSLAVIANNHTLIPYFAKNPCRGFGRTMTTSPAVDDVSRFFNAQVFETPTSWRYLFNLMDDNKIALCGDDNFSIGATHVRERDGIWSILAWLTMIYTQKKSVVDILNNHWEQYGRYYTIKQEYDNIPEDEATKMMTDIENVIVQQSFINKEFSTKLTYTVESAENFVYRDSATDRFTTKHGLKIKMTDGSRIMFTQLNTGNGTCTVRIHAETYSHKQINEDPHVMLKDLLSIANKLSNVNKFSKFSKQ